MSKTSADPVALVASLGPSSSPTGVAVAVIVATLADGSETIITDPTQIRVVNGVVSGIPQNSIAIISQTDGIPVTVGQALSLQVVAAGANGEDLSSQIIWKSDRVTDPLGQGSSVSYTPNTVAMATVTAEIVSAGLKTRASFTVSSADVTVAPHVKVLPDPTVVVEQSAGEVKLTLDPALPTIRVGDVVIGAAGQVDPAKVVSRSQTGSTLTLQTAPALPKEVIEFGTATFEQQVDWSGDSGEVTIVDIPPEPFHLADILTPKWTGFVRGGDPIQKSLKVTASASLDWKPTYRGSVEFDKNIGNGIKYFSLNHDSPIHIYANLDADGFFDWISSAKSFSILPERTKALMVKIGVIPIVFRLTTNSHLDIDPVASVTKHAGFAFGIDDNFKNKIDYDYNSQAEWTYHPELANKTVLSSIDRNTDISNGISSISLSFLTQTEINLPTQITTKSGLRIRTFSATVLQDSSIPLPLRSLAINTSSSLTDTTPILSAETEIKTIGMVDYTMGQIEIDDSFWLKNNPIFISKPLPSPPSTTCFPSLPPLVSTNCILTAESCWDEQYICFCTYDCGTEGTGGTIEKGGWCGA